MSDSKEKKPAHPVTKKKCKCGASFEVSSIVTSGDVKTIKLACPKCGARSKE